MDGYGKELHKGETFTWNVYSDVDTQGTTLDETTTMPEAKYTITQHSLTVTEYGNAVPFTGYLLAPCFLRLLGLLSLKCRLMWQAMHSVVTLLGSNSREGSVLTKTM